MYFTLLLSWVTGTCVIAYLWMVLLVELQIKASPEQITNITPSEYALQSSVNQTVAEILAIICQKSKGTPIFLSMDGANKKGLHHMVKVLSFYDSEINEIYIYQLNADATLETHKSASEAIDYSFQKIDINGNEVTLFG